MIFVPVPPGATYSYPAGQYGEVFIFVENKLFDVRYFFDIIRQNSRHRSVRFRKGENLEDSSMR